MPVELVVSSTLAYEIIDSPGAIGGQAIRCKTCQKTSYNANDVFYRYCGFCHKYHDEMPAANHDQASLF